MIRESSKLVCCDADGCKWDLVFSTDPCESSKRHEQQATVPMVIQIKGLKSQIGYLFVSAH